MREKIQRILLAVICVFLTCCGGHHSEGRFTGRELDVFADQDTFFVVQLPDGSDAYAKSLSLLINGDGQVVTAEGYVALGVAAIAPDVAAIKIAVDGEVSFTTATVLTPTSAGIFEAAQFSAPDKLRAIGGGLFQETEESGFPVIGIFGQDDFGAVQQEYLEF